MELQTRFPIIYSACELHNKKYKKYPQNIIIQNGITYDKSVLSMLSQSDIDNFIQLQIKNPEIIIMCFENLIEILTQNEKQIVTKKSKKIHNQNNPINKIYDKLIKLNVHNNDLSFIDKWCLFIKSQDQFSCFF